MILQNPEIWQYAFPMIILLKSFQYELKKDKVTKKDKDDIFDRIKKNAEENGMEIPEGYLKDMVWPDYKPHFAQMKADHEGYILFATYKRKDKTIWYDIFTEEGVFVKQVKQSGYIFSSVFHKDYIYISGKSEDGFPAIMRYKYK